MGTLSSSNKQRIDNNIERQTKFVKTFGQGGQEGGGGAGGSAAGAGSRQGSQESDRGSLPGSYKKVMV